MSTTLLAILCIPAVVSFYCGMLWGSSRRWFERVIIILTLLIAIAGASALIYNELRENVVSRDNYLPWEDLKVGLVYYAPAYIKNSGQVTAVLEQGGRLHLIDIPFTPHGAYLQVRLGPDGKKVLTELTRTTNSWVFELYAPASRRVTTR